MPELRAPLALSLGRDSISRFLGATEAVLESRLLDRAGRTLQSQLVNPWLGQQVGLAARLLHLPWPASAELN